MTRRIAKETEVVRCNGPCHKVFPLDEDHFHKDATSATGFMSSCVICSAYERRVEEARSIVEKLKKRGIDVLAEGAGCPHSAATFEDLLEVFGGPRGFAKHIYSAYLQCKAGSPGRTRILLTLYSIQMKLTEAGHADKSTEKMTDEELNEQIVKALQNIGRSR